MPYEMFISYARRDNERGQVTALKTHIESSFRPFAGRDLRVLLAILSPHWLASPYCRWEWEDTSRYEAMRECPGEGVAHVFFVSLPDAADPKTDPSPRELDRRDSAPADLRCAPVARRGPTGVAAGRRPADA